ncbi:MAG: hypothetical protein LBN02_09270 [Oscillospiraceae bacterium]|nr:hypothetical protein [Oscillospiraceae bacterium]
MRHRPDVGIALPHTEDFGEPPQEATMYASVFLNGASGINRQAIVTRLRISARNFGRWDSSSFCAVILSTTRF